MNHVAKTKGFTLIELMLAMGFVSALLLAIAMSVIQVGTMYNKGMILKELNQTAREVSNDLDRTIGNQGGFSLDTDYVPVTASGLKIGGRLCLGSVSYLWNYGEALQTNNANIVKDSTGAPVRIAKVVDPTKKYCAKTAGVLNLSSIGAADQPNTTELLRAGDRTLEVYQLEIVKESTAYDSSTGQQLYTIMYTIGSGAYTALNDDRTACKGPGEAGADLQYCAVEQFTLVLRTGGS